MSPITLSRQELYDSIWTKPATKLAEELGISIAQLTRLCDDHDIPRPTSGHWKRLEWGKECERPALSPVATSELEQVIIELNAPRLSKDEPAKIPVPDRLMSPHVMVANALATLQKGKPDRDGVVYACGPNTVRIGVSPKNINRAVRIMDALVKALIEKGFVPQPAHAQEHAPLEMCKAGMKYPLKLREHLHRTALPMTPEQADEMKRWGYCTGDRFKHTPDGKLVLTFGEDYNPVICQDTVNTRLENKLGRFVDRILERIADREERARRYAEERAERERALAEQREREAEEARLRIEEENRIAELMDMLSRWRLSRDIRQWLGETKQLITSHDATPTVGGPVDLWLQWVEAYANRIDPDAPAMDRLKEIRAIKSPGEPPG